MNTLTEAQEQATFQLKNNNKTSACVLWPANEVPGANWHISDDPENEESFWELPDGWTEAGIVLPYIAGHHGGGISTTVIKVIEDMGRFDTSIPDVLAGWARANFLQTPLLVWYPTK